MDLFPLIEALLAFALTMLVLTSIVTAITEILAMLARSRPTPSTPTRGRF